MVDTRNLMAHGTAQDGLPHWPAAVAWWHSRVQLIGPHQEKTELLFFPATEETGLHRVHPTWAGTFVLAALVSIFPGINFILLDSDCLPVTLFEAADLWKEAYLTRFPSGTGKGLPVQRPLHRKREFVNHPDVVFTQHRVNANRQGQGVLLVTEPHSKGRGHAMDMLVPCWKNTKQEAQELWRGLEPHLSKVRCLPYFSCRVLYLSLPYQETECFRPQDCAAIPIMHAYGGAKTGMAQALQSIASEGWIPLAAAMVGTVGKKPMWTDLGLRPVVGTTVTLNFGPVPLSIRKWSCSYPVGNAGIMGRFQGVLSTPGSRM